MRNSRRQDAAAGRFAYREAFPAAPRGHSLLELLAAMAIIAVLAESALAAYRAQILRANRADARAALLALAAAEEMFHLKCNTYTRILDDSRVTSCAPENLRIATRVAGGQYLLEVPIADSSIWEATATTVGGAPQSGDTPCRVLRLASTGARTAATAGGTPNNAECWRR